MYLFLVWIGSRLRSGNTDIVIKTMITFRERLPPADCLRIVTLLLITDNTEISNSAGQSLEKHSVFTRYTKVFDMFC